MCISTKILSRGEEKIWDMVGEAEVEAGLCLGLEEGHSVIYRHGKDPVGFTAEAHVGGFMARTEHICCRQACCPL
jgi:hypothetical protein